MKIEKTEKTIRAKYFADFKHKNGKVYLKRNGWKKHREVELVRTDEYWAVKEVTNQKLL